MYKNVCYITVNQTRSEEVYLNKIVINSTESHLVPKLTFDIYTPNKITKSSIFSVYILPLIEKYKLNRAVDRIAITITTMEEGDEEDYNMNDLYS